MEIFHNWQEVEFSEKYRDIPEYCYSATTQEIAKKDFSLVPSKYIHFNHSEEDTDFEGRIKNIRSQVIEILEEERQAKKEMLAAFKGVGYEIFD